ncbi:MULTISPECIES: WXG100 family type VII secretion target [Streptomyces]|uniref:WXG100 family type VII secretion target n=1 Tax=Streptomyces ramulosus TaxID=47762 RepID=A0ABW1FH86_9ACTN
MSAGGMEKKDEDIRQALSLLNEQMGKMRTAGQTVETTVQSVARNFDSGASRQFQTKMQEWIETYNQVSQKVNTLHDNLEAANQTLNTGDTDAHDLAAGWDAGGGDLDNIHGVLGGSAS